jgi:hypothetical protein
MALTIRKKKEKKNLMEATSYLLPLASIKPVSPNCLKKPLQVPTPPIFVTFGLAVK